MIQANLKLTQSGTNTPSIRVHNNELGELSIERTGAGDFSLKSDSIQFTTINTSIFFGHNLGLDGLFSYYISDGAILIRTGNKDFEQQDGWLLETPFKIEVYL